MAAAAPNGPAIESLLGFWAQAGVDACYAEAPVDRTAEAAVLRPKAAPAQAAAFAKAAPIVAPDVSAAIAEAQALAAAAHDLAALEAAIAGFNGCGLKFEGASKSVFARGAPDAALMVIGEAPGADEDREGAPFVGRAGKLLDRMLGAAGLSERAFITNTVYWRPPGNRTPSPQEQMICAPFLERAILLLKPRLLMLAGGAAAKSVLKREEGILSLRGRWFEWWSSDDSLSIPVLPTLHPAYLLRQPAAKKKAWSDLLTLTERLDRPERPA